MIIMNLFDQIYWISDQKSHFFVPWKTMISFKSEGMWKNAAFSLVSHQGLEEVHDEVVLGFALFLGLRSRFLLRSGLGAGALRLRWCLGLCFQGAGVLCTITESQPLRSAWRQRGSYAHRLNRSIETGAQFRPCLCLLAASPTISLLLTCVSQPSLVDIQQFVPAMSSGMPGKLKYVAGWRFSSWKPTTDKGWTSDQSLLVCYWQLTTWRPKTRSFSQFTFMLH